MEDVEIPGSAGETVRAVVEAAFTGNVAVVEALCTPDVVVQVDGALGFRGRDGLRQLVEFVEEFATESGVEIHRVVSEGDMAALTRTSRLTIGGERVEIAVGSFFRLRDGRVAEWYDHQDLQATWRALGH